MKTHLINVYDFDKTIYDGDCTLDFYLFCVKRKPSLVLHSIRPIVTFALFIIRNRTRDDFKESFYESFLPHINTIDLIELFWNEKIKHIKDFYLQARNDSDIIITASPRFIVEPVAKRLNFRLIASEVDVLTGRLLSENCRGINKVHRLKESAYFSSHDMISNFYTDSYSDRHLVDMASNSYLVQRNNIRLIGEKFTKINIFKSLDFIRFLVVGTANVILGVFFSSILSLVLHPNIAFLVGYPLSLITGYFLMSSITFDNTNYTFIQFAKYCIGYIPNFIIQYLTLLVTFNYMGMSHYISYCIAAIIAIPATFIIMKLKVFKK